VFFGGLELCIIARMADLNAFVLAGGRSSRMGMDKAYVTLGTQTLLERALSLVGGVASAVWIVGGREKFGRFGNVIEDEFPDHGPLGGIHAALRASSSDLNLVLAVDMPFVEVRFLEYLLVKAGGAKAIVTVPRADGAWQPLCAVYRRDFANLAEPALRAGKNKIDPLFAKCDVQVVDEEELSKAGLLTEMFRNLNTPEELSAARTQE